MPRIPHDPYDPHDPFDPHAERALERETDHRGVARIRRKRDRRAARRRLDDLRPERPASSAERFAHPDLQLLFERGLLDEVLREVKSGKEATVWLASTPDGGRLAVKTYKDLEARGFRNDAVYRAGRFVSDARIAKAVERGSRAGLEARQDLWALHEYRILWRLHDAGLPVPAPAVGPDASDLSDAGRAVAMEWIGETRGSEIAAPRLSDLRLGPDAARDAAGQSVELLLGLAGLGLVHGDLSTYNLLLRDGEVVLIDLPQVSDVGGNPSWRELLARDAASLARTLRRAGADVDEGELLRDAFRAAGA